MFYKIFGFLFFLLLPLNLLLAAGLHDEVLKISAGASEKFKKDYREIYFLNPSNSRGEFSSKTLVLGLNGTLLKLRDNHYLKPSQSGFPVQEIRKVLKRAIQAKMRILLISSEYFFASGLQKFFFEEYGISQDTFQKRFHLIGGVPVVSASKFQETSDEEKSQVGEKILAYLKVVKQSGEVFFVHNKEFYLRSALKSFYMDHYRGKLHTKWIHGSITDQKKAWVDVWRDIGGSQSAPFLSCCGIRR